MSRKSFVFVVSLILASITSFPARATLVTVVGTSADNKIYNGNTTATVDFGSAVLNGVAPGDVGNVTLATNSYTATFADKYAESGKTVTIAGLTLSGSAATNYTLVQPTLFADIEPRPLTVTVIGVNKTYNANTNATVTLANNKISGDSITLFYGAASFTNKNVGTGKPVVVSDIFITGLDADNYVLTNTVATTTANITAKTLRVAATGVNKQYDGTTTATVTLSDNHISGDNVTDNYTNAIFADPYVGDGILVSVSGISISGPDAGNYNLNSPVASAQANITPRILNVTATGQNRSYDGTTNATVTLGDDRLSGDNITVSFNSAGFSDKNAGNGKTINVIGIAITGPDSDSYTAASSVLTTTANISGKTLTVVASGQNKIYDGTTNATVTLSDNRISGDSLTNVYSAARFADKNVGAGKTITVSGIALTGPDAGNYSLGNTNATTPANITVRDLTVSATGVNKAYDGTTNATVTLGDNRVAGDSLTDTYANASFTDKNVGNGKTVNVIGIQITGADAANYNLLNVTAATTANITARSLSVAATGQDKIYDGTTNATVTLSDNRLSGDVITLNYGSAYFASKTVGSGKNINVANLSLGGANAGNYALATTNTTANANITARSLAVSATGINKIYDGTVSASVTLSDNRVVGDVFTATYGSATFGSSSVGNNKTITVTDFYLAGNDAGNYSLSNTTVTTTANITPAAVSITLSSSSNPVGFRDNVSFTETLPIDATGTVTFRTNGVAFASGSVSGGTFSGSISNLLRGTNTITASYSGDANYSAATNLLAQIVTNHPPQTGFFSFSVTNGLPLKVAISSLLSAVVDADSDTVALASVGISTNGMVSPTNSAFILFRNTNYVNDRFDYTVKDSYGAVATGQVLVASVMAPFTGQNASLAPSGGSNVLTFHGIPGFVYAVQRSVNLLTWKNISTNTVPGNGTLNYTDRFADLSQPPASAFYRLLWLPN
jgi:hypothetical protein